MPKMVVEPVVVVKEVPDAETRAVRAEVVMADEEPLPAAPVAVELFSMSVSMSHDSKRWYSRDGRG